MSQTTVSSFRTYTIAWIVLAAALLALPVTSIWAGLSGFRGRSVGGVAVDADGIARNVSVAETKQLLQRLRQDLKKPAPELYDPVRMRKVSLRGLEAAIAESLANGQELPDSVRFLAGLQRIQYIFVYPEQNDIVLVGPGEGWKISDDCGIVGVTNGRPVMRLDDLLVALRTVQNARTEGISVSIDPTEEGRRRFDQVRSRQRTFSPAAVKQLAKALGPQEITYTGIPTNSHFARVLMVADHRMKRLAMNMDTSPVRGIPSYLDLLKARNQMPGSAMPRWWMACNYDPLARSQDRLAWELRGAGVKVMTEDEFVAQDGTVQGTGKEDVVAKQWADQFTANFDELSSKDSVFGELRNLMDLCVVAALIQREDLTGLAGIQSFPLLASQDSEYKIEEWFAPQAIDSKCSYLKIGRNYVITASGGVQIESWQVASRQEVKPEVKAVREKAARNSEAKSWWWN